MRFSEETTPEVRCRAHCITPRVHATTMPDHCGGWPWSPGWGHVSGFPAVSYSPCFLCIPVHFGGSTTHSPHLRSRAALHHSEGVCLLKLGGILSPGKFVSLIYLCIYLFNCLFIFIWTHEYSSYTLNYNPIYFILLFKFASDLAVESSFSWLLCPSEIPPSLCSSFVSFPFYSLSSFPPPLPPFLPPLLPSFHGL